ncbi:hypothetical protein ACJX0J_022133, partial [Zea mays]
QSKMFLQNEADAVLQDLHRFGNLDAEEDIEEASPSARGLYLMIPTAQTLVFVLHEQRMIGNGIYRMMICLYWTRMSKDVRVGPSFTFYKTRDNIVIVSFSFRGYHLFLSETAGETSCDFSKLMGLEQSHAGLFGVG